MSRCEICNRFFLTGNSKIRVDNGSLVHETCLFSYRRISSQIADKSVPSSYASGIKNSSVSNFKPRIFQVFNDIYNNAWFCGRRVKPTTKISSFDMSVCSMCDRSILPAEIKMITNNGTLVVHESCFQSSQYDTNNISTALPLNPENAELNSSKNLPTNLAVLKASCIPFPKDGLKLSYFNGEFNSMFGGREHLVGKTTAEVSRMVQQDFVQCSQRSLCEVLKEQHHPAVGTATVFVSHAWEYQFLETINALVQYFINEPDVVVWFDIFSFYRHANLNLDLDWWGSSFKFAIRDLGRTVVVFTRWGDLTLLQRCWCMYEVYCTIVSNSRFDIAMTESSRHAFLQEMIADAAGATHTLSAAIDVAKSLSFEPADRDSILEVLRREVGVNQVNSMVFKCVVQWAVSQLEAEKSVALTYTDGLGRSSGISHGLASLYCSLGRVDEAAPLYEESLSMLQSSLGASHPDALSSMHRLAGFYSQQGQHQRAEVLYKDCLNRRISTLGESHADTLTCMTALAQLYNTRRQFDRAEPLYRDCWLRRQLCLGDSNRDTLAAMNNLALLYSNQGQYIRAESLYQQCLSIKVATLGESHFDTLASLNNLALLYNNQGLYAKAEPLYSDCLTRKKLTLGESHPSTLLSVNNLAVLYSNQKQYSKAESLYQDCLAKKKLTLGESHPSTLVSMNNLADLYKIQGQYNKAEPMLADCLKRRECVLGAEHPNTKLTRKSLMSLRKKMGHISFRSNNFI